MANKLFALLFQGDKNDVKEKLHQKWTEMPGDL